MQDLCSGAIGLDTFRGVAFVGGFSFADVLGSAKGGCRASARSLRCTFRGAASAPLFLTGSRPLTSAGPGLGRTFILGRVPAAGPWVTDVRRGGWVARTASKGAASTQRQHVVLSEGGFSVARSFWFLREAKNPDCCFFNGSFFFFF